MLFVGRRNFVALIAAHAQTWFDRIARYSECAL